MTVIAGLQRLGHALKLISTHGLATVPPSFPHAFGGNPVCSSREAPFLLIVLCASGGAGSPTKALGDDGAGRSADDGAGRSADVGAVRCANDGAERCADNGAERYADKAAGRYADNGEAR